MARGIYAVAHNFYFKFIPEARHYNDQKVNAYIDKLLKDDPLHSWLNTPSSELKAAIRGGELQKVYQKMFSARNVRTRHSSITKQP